VKSLSNRIEDWKGHHLSNFGELLLDDIFVVTKSEVDREYHVFLFEKIILCCKEALPPPPGSRRAGKNNYILKKQQPMNGVSPLPGGSGPSRKKTTPLLLKGRIFLNNVTQAVPSSPRNSIASSSSASQYALAVYWRGDDDLEFFTLRCRNEEQMKQWETQINRLIKEVAVRRASERGISRIASLNTNPASLRQPSSVYEKAWSATTATESVYHNGQTNGHHRRPSPTSGDEHIIPPTPNGPYVGGPAGYPAHDGFDPDDDDFEDYPTASSSTYASSGRGTPIGNRRGMSQSMPPEHDAVPGYDRPRARTEDTNGHVMAQWRSNGLPPHPGSGSIPPGSGARPTTPHSVSAPSYASDSSFGPGGRTSRHTVRSQVSSTKLKTAYENGDTRSKTPAPINGMPPPSRSRSISQPNAYTPAKSAAPPLPNATPWIHRSNAPARSTKRGSGSSQSTGESSDYSPNSSSPITPFGSSESSLAGIRPARTQPYEVSVPTPMQFAPPVKVKVHFHEDIFVIQVPRSTEYTELVEKVGRKIRLCGPRRDDGPLRVKYKDEDGDMVSLGSTEDVQMAFEHYRPGGQVTLFVT
jgi:cell division control protein 24